VKKGGTFRKRGGRAVSRIWGPSRNPQFCTSVEIVEQRVKQRCFQWRKTTARESTSDAFYLLHLSQDTGTRQPSEKKCPGLFCKTPCEDSFSHACGDSDRGKTSCRYKGRNPTVRVGRTPHQRKNDLRRETHTTFYEDRGEEKRSHGKKRILIEVKKKKGSQKMSIRYRISLVLFPGLASKRTLGERRGAEYPRGPLKPRGCLMDRLPSSKETGRKSGGNPSDCCRSGRRQAKPGSGCENRKSTVPVCPAAENR